eukprot:2753326-Pleurochrysis_carterae.AAC.1
MQLFDRAALMEPSSEMAVSIMAAALLGEESQQWKDLGDASIPEATEKMELWAMLLDGAYSEVLCTPAATTLLELVKTGGVEAVEHYVEAGDGGD